MISNGYSVKVLNKWLNARLKSIGGTVSLTDIKDLKLAHTILKATGWASRAKYEEGGPQLGTRAWPCARQECSESHRAIFDETGYPRRTHFQFFFCSGKVVVAEYTYTNYPNSFDRYVSNLTIAPDSPAELSRSRWMAFVIIKTLESWGRTAHWK